MIVSCVQISAVCQRLIRESPATYGGVLVCSRKALGLQGSSSLLSRPSSTDRALVVSVLGGVLVNLFYLETCGIEPGPSWYTYI